MNRYFISRTSLVLMSIAVIASLKDLPSLAEYGLDVVFYLTASLFVFFIPTALASIELTTLFPVRGGVYIWVSEAFGNKMGFFAIWLQWIGNIFWFPTLLSFAASSIAFLLYPPFAENQLFMVTTVLISFWGFTFLNTLGLRISTRITTIGALIGTLLPGLFIILLGILWFSSGNQLTESFEWRGVVPSFETLRDFVFFSAVLLAFLGIELPAVHIEDIENPAKDYPRGILTATFIIFFLLLFGALSVASVVPVKTLNIESGVMQGFQFFFRQYNISWMTPLFALLTAIGAFATVNVWILGPTKGFIVAGQRGDLPPFFHKMNENNMPTNLLILQAIIVTILSLFLLMLPDVKTIFWVLSVMTGNIYVVMYLVIFSALIKHRFLRPVQKRVNATWIPRGFFWITIVFGITSSTFGFISGFIPPTSIIGMNILYYELSVGLCLAIALITPFVILKCKNDSWDIHLHEAPPVHPEETNEK